MKYAKYLLAVGALMAGTAQAQATTITYWNFLGGGDGARMKQLVDGYNASQNKFKIEQTTLPWGVPFYTKVRTSAAVGQAPDLISFHLSRISGWAPDNLLRPISSEELASVGLKKSDFFPRLWDAANHQGKTYAVPLDTHPFVLYYNKDLAGKAGLLDANGRLKPINSMEAFTAAFKAVKEKTGKAGLAFQNNPTSSAPWRMWITLLNQQGAKIVENNKIVAGEQGKKALATMADWVKNGYVLKNTDYPTFVAQFTTGEAAFMLNGVWEVPSMVDGRKANKIAFDYGVLPMPALNGSQDAWADSHGLAIPNNARKPISKENLAGALDFIAYVQKNGIVWAQGGHIPAFLPTVNSKQYDELKPNSDYADTAAKNAVFDPPGWFSGAAGPLQSTAMKYFPAAVQGEISVDQAWSMFVADANKMMAGDPTP